MRILVLADEADKRLWDYLDRRRLEGIDLILSCGDLPGDYLSFLTCFTHAPILYVHGNHDTRYETKPPEGCVCVEDMIYVHEGIRILGLGGSMRYKPGAHQYSEKEMCKRVRKLWTKLWYHKGFDILLTHAPAYQLGDADDLPHRGFEVFRKLMLKYRPRYLVHGHVHKEYMHDFKRENHWEDTTIVNAWMSYVIEI